MGAAAPGAQFAGRYLGVKTVTVFPDNASLGKPAVFGTYLLLSAETGETLAAMDATRLTAGAPRRHRPWPAATCRDPMPRGC